MSPGRGFLAAMGFLTVLPTPRGAASSPGTGAFPLVGLFVGAAVAIPLSLPLPDLARAALALMVGVVLTGGLHEDAWIDACDAALAPGDRARRVAIVSDPRAGAHGVTGLAILLILRLSALAAVPPLAAVAAAVIGRWAMVLAARAFPPLRPSGLGGWFAAEARPAAATARALGALIAVAAGAVLFGFPGAGASAAGLAPPDMAGGFSHAAALAGVAWAAGAAAGAAVGSFLTLRLGGLNGDGFGSVGVAAELGALWGALLMVAWGPAWWS